jgi:hypothetical protein
LDEFWMWQPLGFADRHGWGVLIIDDNVDVADMLSAYLQQIGHFSPHHETGRPGGMGRSHCQRRQFGLTEVKPAENRVAVHDVAPTES